MNDRPSAEELLEAVRQYLLTEVAPVAPDQRARFRALIAANVLAVVRREVATYGESVDGREELADLSRLLASLSAVPPPASPPGQGRIGEQRAALEDANRRLAEQIRAGAADGGTAARAVRDVVRGLVERKLAVSNPPFLARFDIDPT